MSDYQLTATEAAVIRTVDQAYIPNDPANRDWVEYQNWLALGNVPDPYVEPPPPPPEPPTQQQQDVVLYDHENRLRTLEGQPPLTLGDFIANARARQ
jgi:hypothetical protein